MINKELFKDLFKDNLVKCPTKMYHGSRNNSLDLRKLYVNQVNKTFGEFRQIWGGHISLTDKLEEAKVYAKQISPFENEKKIDINPTIHEFEIENKDEYFINATSRLSERFIEGIIVPLLYELLTTEEFKKYPCYESHFALYGLIHEGVFNSNAIDEVTLMNMYSTTPFLTGIGNFGNIEEFTPLNRLIAIKTEAIGICGDVPGPIIENGMPKQMMDYSIHEIEKIKLVKSYKA
ncbi:hypothetical protein KY334_06735 [Candidatus Woesearchaeota archaeon]|nr:hypothetical protein [Candidatus Woesearchaeota archaeon]